MLYKTIILFCLIGCSTIAQTSQKYIVKGKVTLSLSYCGGVEPSQEELEKQTRPNPYINKVFYLRKGKENDLKQKVVMEFKTDSLGMFSFKLPPGIYCIIQKEQLKKLDLKAYSKKSNNIVVDTECLKTWWKKPYHILEIKNKDVDLNFSFHHNCFMNSDIPCLQYNGPMPP